MTNFQLSLEVLTEMHEKLSEAVKLYDKILTEQLSRWRTGPVASSSTQPVNSGYAPQYQQQQQYSQWSSSPQAPIASPPPVQTQASYFPAQSPIQQPNGYVVSPPPPDSYQTMYQASQPVSIPQQSPPELAQQPQYAPPPVSVPQYQTSSTPTQASFSAPPPPPTSQPIQQQSYQPVQSPPASQLQRHNTVASRPAAPAQYAAQKGLARSNTMSHTPQQLMHLQQTSVPAQLPNFPMVPASPPQGYQAYAPQPEPKREEALLIEL